MYVVKANDEEFEIVEVEDNDEELKCVEVIEKDDTVIEQSINSVVGLTNPGTMKVRGKISK